MNDAFEWFDPYEQKERAEREARRADRGIQTGRGEVEASIARGIRNHLDAKLDLAVSGLAEKIAHRVAFEVAAKGAHWQVSKEYGRVCGDAMRKACESVLTGLKLHEIVRVHARVDQSIVSGEETMTIEYETLRPIRVAHAIRL